MTTATSEPDSSRRSLRLTIVTPLQVVLDLDGVRHVRAEDATGSFGILPGHADFLTVLTVAVLMYRTGDGVDPDGRDGAVTGVEHFVGLRGGTLFVTHGRHVQVFAREAIPSDDLQALSVEVKPSTSTTTTLDGPTGCRHPARCCGRGSRSRCITFVPEVGQSLPCCPR